MPVGLGLQLGRNPNHQNVLGDSPTASPISWERVQFAPAQPLLPGVSMLALVRLVRPILTLVCFLLVSLPACGDRTDPETQYLTDSTEHLEPFVSGDVVQEPRDVASTNESEAIHVATIQAEEVPFAKEPVHSSEVSRVESTQTFLPRSTLKEMEQAGFEEILSERTITSKVFADAEGAHRGFFFIGPIHYRGPNGAWLDIDTTVQSLDEEHYGVESNIYGVRFPKRPSDDLALAEIRLPEGGEIEYRVEAIRLGDRTWDRNNLEVQTSSLGNAISYHLPRLGVELRYTVLTERLKEDVILAPDAALRDLCHEGDLELIFSIGATDPLVPLSDLGQHGVFTLDQDLPVQLSNGEVFSIESVFAKAGDEAHGWRPLDIHGEAALEGRNISLRVTLECSKLKAVAGETVLIDPTVATFHPTETTFISKSFPDDNYCTGVVGQPLLLAGLSQRPWPNRSYGQTMAFLMFNSLPNVCSSSMAHGYLSIDRERQDEVVTLSVARASCTWASSGCASMSWNTTDGTCRDGDRARIWPGTDHGITLAAGTTRINLNALNAIHSIVDTGGVIVVEGLSTGDGNRAVTFYSHLSSINSQKPYLDVGWHRVCTPHSPESQSCGHCGTRSRICASDGCSWSSWTACTGEGCPPGDTRCSGSNVQECNASCEWVHQTSCDCGCSNGSCIAQVCSPGATRCDGNNVQVCRMDGCGWTYQASCDCGCSNGSCIAQVCSSGETRCEGNNVETCRTDGCGWTHQTTCACGCSNGSCISPVCSVGETRCSGDSVEQCDADGCGWSHSQTCSCGCVAGSCTQQACSPGETRCSGDNVERCDTDGCGWSHSQTCSCGCVDGTCATQVCVPGATQCDGNNVERCNPDGCGWSYDESCSCACVGGSCEAQVCTPGATRCDGNNVEKCAADGCGWSHDESCSCGCVGGSCSAPACTPGETRCRGNALERCDSGGCDWVHQETCACGCDADQCVSPCGCEGDASRDCRDCGTETRTCVDGVWTDWGSCEPTHQCSAPQICNSEAWCVAPPTTCPEGVQAECEPGATRDCGDGGIETCMEDCQWGECEGGNGEPDGGVVAYGGGCCSVASSTSSGSTWMLILVLLFAALRSRPKHR